MQEDDESPHEQILMERRQTKAWKKDLSTRPEKRWVEPKKKLGAEGFSFSSVIGIRK